MFRKVRYTPLPPSTSTSRPGGPVKGGMSVQDLQEGKIHTVPPSISTTRPGGSVKGGMSVQDVQEGKRHPSHPPPPPLDLEDLSRVACLSKMFRKVRYMPLPPSTSTSTSRPGGPVKGGLSVQDVQEGKRHPSHPPPPPLDLEDLSRVACLSKMFRKVRYMPLPASTSTSTSRPGGPVKGGLSVQDVQEGKIHAAPTLHLHLHL